MLAFLQALHHARENFGIEVPKRNWEVWETWTKSFPKGDLSFPGRYWAATIDNMNNSHLPQVEEDLLKNGYTLVKSYTGWKSATKGCCPGFIFHCSTMEDVPNNIPNCTIQLLIG